MRRKLVLAVPLFLIIAGCTPLGLGTPAATPKAPYTMPPPTPTLSPIATVAPTGHGRPYTPEMIAVELQDVPYNFPPQLQKDYVAAALADRIWTYDGRPYRDLNISGSCNDGVPIRCDLTVSGLPAFAPTTDNIDGYYFSVDLSSGLVASGSIGLRGFPPEIAPEVDALARSLDTEGRLMKMPLRFVVWNLPPPDDAFRLAYGDNEVGDLTIFVTLDRANRQILSMEDWVCCG